MSEKESKEETIQLELPPTVEGGSVAQAGIFVSEGDLLAPVKVTALSSLIELSTKRISFNDFIREGLLIFMRAIPSEAGSILELNHEDQILFFRAMVGTSSDTIASVSVPMGQGIAGYVAESKQPMVIDDVSENKQHLKSIDKFVGFKTKSLVAIPMLIQGKTFGVLELLNRVGEDTFSQSDVEVISFINDHFSKIIETRLMISWSLKKRAKAA